MSTPGGDEVGTTSVPNDKDKTWYQSLFSAPRSRRDSAETCVTRTSEVWDTIRTKKIPRTYHQTGEAIIVRPVSDLPDDFQGRLQAYLDEKDEKKERRKKKDKKQK